MPIAKLFVEGNLESEVLNPILQGNPVLQRGGSKNSLKPRAYTERRESRVVAGYLRDRDFNYDPPEDLTRPTVNSAINGDVIGWRWCRHEIENYLIDPAIVSEAMAWTVPEVEEAVRHAAMTIRWYQAARWTVGIVQCPAATLQPAHATGWTARNRFAGGTGHGCRLDMGFRQRRGPSIRHGRCDGPGCCANIVRCAQCPFRRCVCHRRSRDSGLVLRERLVRWHG